MAITAPDLQKLVCGGCKFAQDPPPNVNMGQGANKICFGLPPSVTSFMVGRDPQGNPQFGSYAARPTVSSHDTACGLYKTKLALQ